MRKILFIDRDGTLVEEPKLDKQLDSFDKLCFLPGVFKYLNKISKELDFELVMVTNQDGLGTDSFPEITFWPVQNFIINSFKNEQVSFFKTHIDKSFENENSNYRKPRTGMLTEYVEDAKIDMQNSFVIGDRVSDMQLAKNLNCSGIFYNGSDLDNSLNDVVKLKTDSWKSVYDYLSGLSRYSTFERVTNETKINIELDLDGTGKSDIDTGLSFFDHMLDQISKHSLVDLNIKVDGDLNVDEHHTIEDSAIALGESFSALLGKKIGIERYAFSLPMDDCLAQVAIDFGGRSRLVWDAEFKREKIGDVPTEMFYHFFKSFCDGAKLNANIKVEGTNEHHKIESIFKAFAKCIKSAISKNRNKLILPSTKGVL
jgi:imidazoleglycerol-phosphate dehydratase / histidinol-phosphatase|tara:strand:- start:38442 stop:39554 length:1113 start_codon:yes stop_codon:yes gene_type:complete